MGGRHEQDLCLVWSCDSNRCGTWDRTDEPCALSGLPRGAADCTFDERSAPGRWQTPPKLIFESVLAAKNPTGHGEPIPVRAEVKHPQIGGRKDFVLRVELESVDTSCIDAVEIGSSNTGSSSKMEHFRRAAPVVVVAVCLA